MKKSGTMWRVRVWSGSFSVYFIVRANTISEAKTIALFLFAERIGVAGTVKEEDIKRETW